MSKIVKYRLVTNHDKEWFINSINEYIENGYQPFGSPFQSTFCDMITPEYCQAMVKYGENKDE